MKYTTLVVYLGLWLWTPTLGIRKIEYSSNGSLRIAASRRNVSVSEHKGDSDLGLRPTGFVNIEAEQVTDGHGHGHGHEEGHGPDDKVQHNGHGDIVSSPDYGYTPVDDEEDYEDHGGHRDAHGDGHGHGAGHGNDQEHGHGDGHGHGAGHGYDPVAASLAKVLLATVSFVMVLFYFVNHHDVDVAEATWMTLSNMVAIFCAVLFFSAGNTTISDFAETDPHHHGPPSPKALGISFARYVILVAILEVVFSQFKTNPWTFKMTTSILAHVVGFSAIDAFGSAMQLEFFSGSLFMSCLGVLVFACVIAAIPLALASLRDAVEGTHHWKDECFEAQTEYVGLAVGLLLSMLIRFSISGELPPVHGSPRSKTPTMAWTLLAAACLTIPLVLFFAIVKYHLHESHATHSKVRIAEIAEQTASMTMGWSLLYWGYWQFYSWVGDKDEDFGPGGKMSQRLASAVIFSAIVFGAILIIDAIADQLRNAPAMAKGCRVLLKTFALLMGLAWEACFNEAVHAIGLKYDGREQTAVIVGLSLGTLAVVLPAWALYILPKTVSEHFVGHFLGTHETDHGDSFGRDHRKDWEKHRSASLFIQD